MIFVSSHISDKELLDLKNDISILFPKYVITDIEKPDIKFRVVSIPEYMMIAEPNVPILTPISIHQMINRKVNTNRFTFPLHGFINLHLYQRKIAFSGFGSSRQKLKDMSYRMGAIVERAVSSKTSLLVSKSLRSDKAQAALKFNIPIVQEQFIYDLFQSSNILNEENYKLQLFSGLVFTTSCCDKNEKKLLMDYITENGGTFLGGLYSKTSIVISKSNANSTKLKEALDMKKTIILDNFKEFYSTPESLKNDALPPLIPSELFSNLSFFISPKLEHSYQNIFFELKILIQQHSGTIINDAESANYIIQMDTENDNYVERLSQHARESQSHGNKRKFSFNDSNNSTSNTTYSSGNNSIPKMCPRTPIWIERCVEEGKILPPSEFPLYKPTSQSKRNGNFYVSLTGFNGYDYLNIISALKWLDIRYSTRFKKSMTHLIAKDNHSSKKTKAAADWDIPVVGIDWLFNIANGNLTSEALSNPWSPKRSQKVSTGISASKITINLDISDDDIDVQIIDGKTSNNNINTDSVQSSSNSKISNQKNKFNSPLLKSGSSSQRVPQSPIRIQSIQNESRILNDITKSQPKQMTSFLDDDDDDFPDDLYEEIISHKITPKEIPSTNNIILANNSPKKEKEKISVAKANSVSFLSPSPKKSQALSQVSPKPIRLNQPDKNHQNFLLSTDSDDEYINIENVISKTNAAPLSQSNINNKFSTNKIDIDPNLESIEISSNLRKDISNIGNSFQNNSTGTKIDSKPSFQDRFDNKESILKSQQFSQQKNPVKSSINNTTPPSSTPKNVTINTERSKSEKLMTPPSVIKDHQNGQINRNQSLFELSMRQPSPPPPPSVHQIPRQTNQQQNFGPSKISAVTVKTEPQNIVKMPVSQSSNQHQKAVTIITNEPQNIQHPKQLQTKKPVLHFLDDDDDDDDEDFVEYEQKAAKNTKIADASNYIMKIVNRRRKTKKSNNSKSKDSKGNAGAADAQPKDIYNEENSDSQYELFTQKPVDNDNDGMPTISYEDKDEPAKETIVTDNDEDPLLTLLQK